MPQEQSAKEPSTAEPSLIAPSMSDLLSITEASEELSTAAQDRMENLGPQELYPIDHKPSPAEPPSAKKWEKPKRQSENSRVKLRLFATDTLLLLVRLVSKWGIVVRCLLYLLAGALTVLLVALVHAGQQMPPPTYLLRHNHTQFDYTDRLYPCFTNATTPIQWSQWSTNCSAPLCTGKDPRVAAGLHRRSPSSDAAVTFRYRHSPHCAPTQQTRPCRRVCCPTGYTVAPRSTRCYKLSNISCSTATDSNCISEDVLIDGKRFTARLATPSSHAEAEYLTTFSGGKRIWTGFTKQPIAIKTPLCAYLDKSVPSKEVSLQWAENCKKTDVQAVFQIDMAEINL